MSTIEGQPAFPDWPADWPERQVVDLDNVGDPGIWLEEQIDPEEVLHGDPARLDQLAGQLADAYIQVAGEMSFPLPSDFEVSEEECREMVKGEFLGFIREWRRSAFEQKSKVAGRTS